MDEPLPDWVRALLVCPQCRGELLGEPRGLVCPPCRRLYPIIDGIPRMAPEEAIRL